MQKQNVIIFSSFQSLELVKKLKAGIEERCKEIEVVNWEEYFKSVYPQNYSKKKAFPLFRFLTKRVPSFDFAILIAGGEDEIHRGVKDPQKKEPEIYLGMRDNVIFELGMCCMALGESRVILLHKNDTQLFADLRGLNSDQKMLKGDNGKRKCTQLTINNIQLKAFEYSDENNVEELSRKIVDYINEKSDDYSPVVVGAACSTAQGYMDNFIMSAANAFKAYREGKDNVVLEIAGKKLEKEPETLEFRILLPTADACRNVPEILSDTKTASAGIYNCRKSKISNGELKPSKGRSVLFACKQKGSTLQIIDIPTTFQASYKTAEAILGIKDDALSDAERFRYITKEISMFAATLTKLTQQANEKNAGIKVVIEYASFDCDVDRKNLPWLYE